MIKIDPIFRKVLLIGLFLICSMIGYAQKTDTLKSSLLKKMESIDHPGDSELKFNLLFSLMGKPELSYEMIIKDNMGIGAAIFVGLTKSLAYKFSFTPYYRFYSGKNKASGFFIEGNTGILTLEDDYWTSNSNRPIRTKTTNLTLGLAAGTKLIIRNGFLAEAYVGYGKLIANRIGYNTQDVQRIAIAIGKRF